MVNEPSRLSKNELTTNKLDPQKLKIGITFLSTNSPKVARSVLSILI